MPILPQTGTSYITGYNARKLFHDHNINNPSW